MKRWSSLAVIIAVLAVGFLSIAPRLTARAAPVSTGLSVTVAPLALAPGQAGYVHIGGGYPLTVNVTLDDKPLNVFWTGDGYEAIYSFSLDAVETAHTLVISASDPRTGATASQTAMVEVSSFTYQDEQLAIPYRLQPLLDPVLNQQELDHLAEIYARQTTPSAWDYPFAVPVVGGIITSRYGGNRIYNGGVLAARHTGVDFRRSIGEPVMATANGVVVFAQHVDIRGNVIIIDHGYGVFSQYAHLSQVMVRPGDFILQGQVIGLAGATGRTNGPHLHFEIIADGNPVDPIKWLSLAPDFIPPREATPRP